MEWVRIGQNPWGDEILLGLAWDVLWLVVITGAVFMAGHAYFARKKAGEAKRIDDAAAAGLPERITRHGVSARYSHWALAIATLTLVATAFVPIIGIQFPWVTVHWLAGIVLAAYIVYHTLDTLVRMSWGKMWIGIKDIRDSFGRTREFLEGSAGDPAKRPGKWGIENKIFHHMTAVAGLAVAATGILMMLRIETWFWGANPYFRDIPDTTWGWVFVVHGISAVGFVGLLMAHIYFALRPDKLWFTRSMFKGWITREEYLAHFNPSRWRVAKDGGKPVQFEQAETVTVGAGSGSSLSGTPE